MRETGLLRAMMLSFFSRDLYREVGTRWPGLGFGYLALAVLIALLPMVLVYSASALRMDMKNPIDLEYIVQQVPEVRFEKGVMSATVNQPYYIRSREGDAVIAVIDTTRPVTDWTKEENFRGLVLGEKQALLRKDGNESRLYDYPVDSDFQVTREVAYDVTESALNYLWLLPILLLPFVWGVLFIFRILQAFVYAVAGKVMATICGAPVGYSGCVRLASVAITPAIALFTVCGLISVTLPGLVYFVLAMGYLFFAVKSNA